MDNTNNKEFWNNYVDYFVNKINEANSECDAKDKTASDIVYEQYFKQLDVKGNEKLLDFGCGFCRLFPIYEENMHSEKNVKGGYYGVDVSKRELELAQERYPRLKLGESLFEYDGLHIPFIDNYFDKIICWGVFDACNQEIIIQELFRILKIGGKLLVTGKNDKYYEDDEAAKMAEVNARKKGHPNYFTDVHNLTTQLQEHNIKLDATYYFLRRGDFTRNHAVREMPKIFYEWAYVMEKLENYKYYEYGKFSDKYSLMFQKK